MFSEKKLENDIYAYTTKKINEYVNTHNDSVQAYKKAEDALSRVIDEVFEQHLAVVHIQKQLAKRGVA